jgi:cation diffusion facilitator family transporter
MLDRGGVCQPTTVQEGSRRAIIAAFLANLGIAIMKFIGAAVTASASLLAEAVHSLADTGNQALLILGGHKAKRAATREHPFGYGRERYFWSFVVAQVLFLLGGAFAIYEGIQKLRHPHEPESLWWAVGILVGSMVLEGFSFRTAVTEANHSRAGVHWLPFIRRTKSPELPVVLLEDSGALLGLSFALFGVVMAKVTGNGRWDALGSLAIGVLLCVIAIFLASEMKGLLIGESANPEVERQIVAAMIGTEPVRQLIHLRTQHLGPDELLVGAKLEFDPSLSVEQLAQAIDATEANVRQTVPAARIIYLEPDIKRSDGGSAATPAEDVTHHDGDPTPDARATPAEDVRRHDGDPTPDVSRTPTAPDTAR